MKKIMAIVVFGLAMMVGTVASADIAGLPITVGTDAAFNSKYIWRGINLTDEAVMQPDVWLSYEGFTFNVWANMDLTDINKTAGINLGAGNINEVDYTVSYSTTAFEKLNLTVGNIVYDFPHTTFKRTAEVYGSVGYDMLLSPTVTVYYDYIAANGFYGAFGVSHGFELPKIAEPVSESLNLSASVGFASTNWNNYYLLGNQSAVNNLLLTAALPVSIGDHVTISPSVSYSAMLDGTVRTNAVNDHNVIYGVLLSGSF